jgi:hypothetical protein
MKRLWLLVLVAVLFAQTPVTLPDISGDGAVHAVASSGEALTITFYAPPGNSTTNCGATAVSGCVRIGDANISASRGTILLPGATAYLGPLPVPGVTVYQLSEWHYLVQSGDKLIVSYIKR